MKLRKSFCELQGIALPVSVYILMLAILVLCRHNHMPYNMWMGLLYSVLPAMAVWAIVKPLKRFSFFPMIFVYVFLFGEIFTLFFNHTPYSPCVVNLIAETDSQESSGFLRSALTTPAFYYSLIIMVAAYVVSMGIAYAVSFIGKKVKRICLYVVLALALVSGGYLVKSYVTLHYRFNDPDLDYFIMHRDDPPEYYTTVTRFLGGAAYVYSSSSSVDKIRERLLEAKVDGCTYDSPLIVLVLGESYNKHHTSLYEPEYRNTTPRM